MPGLYAGADPQAEWERWSCVAEVLEPYLGVLARHQVYVTAMWFKYR